MLESVTQGKAPTPPTTILLEKTTPSKVLRYMASGLIVEAVVHPGPRGFLVAEWPEEAGFPSSNETEVPNLLFGNFNKKEMDEPSVMKRPADMDEPIVKKRPAAMDEPIVKKRPAAMDEPIVKKRPAGRFQVMYYKNTNAVALRHLDGDKRQVCQCVAPKSMSEEVLRASAQEVIQQLEEGLDEQEAKSQLRNCLSSHMLDN